MNANDDIEKLKRLKMIIARLENERSSYESEWRQIQRFVSPRRGRFFTAEQNRSKAQLNDIVRNTGTLASRTLAAGMMAGITSPARPWFRLNPAQERLNEVYSVKSWLATVERTLYEVFAASNFYDSLPLVYSELGDFGTAGMIAKEDFDDVVRFFPMTVGQYWIGTSDRGNVDTFVRKFQMTIEQMVERFGEDKVSKTNLERYRNGRGREWLDVTHVIMRNYGRKPWMLDAANKPFVEYYFETAAQKDESTFLAVGGYDSDPMMCPRWGVIGTDAYASSCPGYEALGDIKQLQSQVREKAKAVAKMVNPPMRAPASMKNEYTSTVAGDITYVSGHQGAGQFEPAYVVQPRVMELAEDIMRTEEAINAAYYVPLFQMLTMGPQRDRTAREVDEIHEEKMIMLGPVLERTHNEMLRKAIDFTFDRCMRVGILPDPPEEMRGTEIKIEYISMLAQAQQMIGIGSMERTVGFIGNLAGANPEVLDKVDFDQAVDEYTEMVGSPPSMIRSDEDVLKIRQARAQAMAAQQAAEQASQGVQAAKLLSETKTGTGSALDMIRNATGG